MKIIEGQLKGITIQYKEQKETRVSSEKVRKAVFDVLKNLIHIEGAKVVDLFCGSGMYGLEAISRGAVSATFVDENRNVIGSLKRNIKILNIKYYDIRILNKKFENFIEHYGYTQEHGTNNLFDLVFADPPYYQFDFGKFNDIHKILNTDGIFVLEQSKRGGTKELNGLELFLEKKYGDTRVLFFRKK